MNRDLSVVVELTSKHCILDSFVDHDGYSISSKEFLTTVVEKTLESPLDCKEIQPVHSKGDQPWLFFGRNDAKAEIPFLWKE